jgi:methionyl-tRNA formyltransferase
MNVVFFGTAPFGIPAFARLIRAHKVVAVVSTPPRPQGRGLRLGESPVAVFARQQGITPVFTPEKLNDPDFIGALAQCGADIFIVIAFRILPARLFSLPPLGTVNIHASLLPKYRGPAPIQRAIEAGEKETGVTVFRIDDGVDTGGILLQKRVSIGPDETAAELYERLGDCGANAIIEALEGLHRGTLRLLPQDNAQASRAPKLTKEEARIDWRQPAQAIYNKIRAFKSFPGTYALLDGKRLGIERAAPVEKSSPGEAGTIVTIADSFFDVRCMPGGVLRVLEVKPEGRRSMNVRDFLSGNKLMEGTCLS